MKIKAKILKNILLGLLSLSLMFSPLAQVSSVYSAPEKPEKPVSTYEEPDAPEAPDAPSEPDAPEAPDAPRRGERDYEETREDYDDSNPSDEEESSNGTGTEETILSQEPADNPVEVTESPASPELASGVGLVGGSQDNFVGDVEVETGDGNNSSNILNLGNMNASGSGTGGEAGSDVSVINSSNGTGSVNGADVVLGSEDVLVQDNKADVNNDVDQATVTGNNSASRNVGSSSIDTGEANVSTTIINALNTNVAGGMVAEFNVMDDQMGDLVLDFAANCIAGCGGNPLLAKNDGNGSNSNNDISASMLDSAMTFQNNDASLDNNVVLEANSGDNTAKDNTGGDVSIKTGDANVAANIFNFANTNIAGNAYFGVVNLYGDLIGDIILPELSFSGCEVCGSDTTLANLGNGSNSNNAINFGSYDADNIFQFNEALINNTLAMDATTGENSASDNTGGDVSITTGDSEVQANILNVANTNMVGGDWWLVLINQAGQWIGQILGAPAGALYAGSEGTLFGTSPSGELTAVNQGNGTGSNNNIGVKESDITTTVQNNKASINNTLDLTANTGGNDASRNTGGNVDIKTGDANITANIVNFINNNIVGSGRIFVTVINVFGDWVGDFVSPGHTKQKELTQNPAPVGGPQEEVVNLAGMPESQNQDEDHDNAVVTTKSSDVSNESNGSASGSGASPSTPTTGIWVASASSSGLVAGAVSGVVDSALESVPSQEDVQNVAESPKKEVNINLAWLLLLIPVYGVYKVRRYFWV